MRLRHLLSLGRAPGRRQKPHCLLNHLPNQMDWGRSGYSRQSDRLGYLHTRNQQSRLRRTSFHLNIPRLPSPMKQL